MDPISTLQLRRAAAKCFVSKDLRDPLQRFHGFGGINPAKSLNPDILKIGGGVRRNKKKRPPASAGGPARYSLLTSHWQPGILIFEIHVDQLNVPLDCRYSVVNHIVQSSTGSTLMLL